MIVGVRHASTNGVTDSRMDVGVLIAQRLPDDLVDRHPAPTGHRRPMSRSARSTSGRWSAATPICSCMRRSRRSATVAGWRASASSSTPSSTRPAAGKSSASNRPGGDRGVLEGGSFPHSSPAGLGAECRSDGSGAARPRSTGRRRGRGSASRSRTAAPGYLTAVTTSPSTSSMSANSAMPSRRWKRLFAMSQTRTMRAGGSPTERR